MGAQTAQAEEENQPKPQDTGLQAGCYVQRYYALPNRSHVYPLRNKEYQQQFGGNA